MKQEIKLISQHYGKERLIRQGISCCAVLIQVFNKMLDSNANERRELDEEINDAFVDQVSCLQIVTDSLADTFGMDCQINYKRKLLLKTLIRSAKQEIIHEHETK